MRKTVTVQFPTPSKFAYSLILKEFYKNFAASLTHHL